MTTDKHRELISRMEKLLADPGFQNELAQVRSKATLQAIGDIETSPRWTYIANRFSRNSAAAMYALETEAIKDPSSAGVHEHQARQVALAWESLARLTEGTNKPVALLNAALSYELAGYQANAAYLAKEVGDDSELGVLLLVASFLQRRLITTQQAADQILRNQPDPELPLDTLAFELGGVLLGDSLSKACRFFLNGDQSSIDEALKLLAESANLFGSIGAPLQANITYGVQAVLPLMKRRSMWSQLHRLVKDSEVWKRYLTLIARGTSGPLSRGVTELWPSQIQVIDSGILGSNNSAIVRLPTGGGKTRIAEMAIIDTIQRCPEAKCVFVAPYRALAFEVERTLGSVLNDLGYRVSSVIGSYESDEFEEFLLKTADLLIVTPEKLDLVLRLHPQIMDQIKLIVLDEIHVIDDESRGVKFELLLSRIKARLPTCRFLAMSAVVPDSTLKNFATWLAGSSNRSVSSNWRPTIQRIARFEWQNTKGVIRFENDEEMPDLDTFIPGVLQRRPYSFVHPATRRRRIRNYPQPEKGDTVADLAYVFSEQGPVLVFCTQPNWVNSVCKKILENSIAYRQMANIQVHPHFVNSAQTASFNLAREWLGEEHIVTKSLSQGIAPHHGQLPNAVREAIEADCRAGQYRVIVATNTLAQGVNLPVRVVIIHSTWRVDDTGQRSRISVRDYWNIAGRAGRAGYETEGLVIHVTLNQTDRRDFEYYKNRHNLEPVTGALFQKLQQLIEPRFSNATIEDAATVLDPEILAIAVEEGIENADSEKWDTCLSGTYTDLQAKIHNVEIDPLVQAVRRAAKQVFTRAPEPLRRQVYAQTGLSSSSCNILSRFVDNHAAELRELLLHAGHDLERLNGLIIEVSLPLPEAQTNSAFSGDPEVLLDLWLQGKPIQDIYKLTSATDPVEQLSRYIQDLFGYRLPWIISGMFRIARESLDIQENNLTEYIRSYSSMVKYGLPDSVATWAMSAGITARRTALQIAEAFQTISTGQSHEDFITWLADLSDDSLRNDYEISGYVLEELRYKLGRMAINDLLRPIRPLHEMLPKRTKVAGIFYNNRRIAARRVQVGDGLELRRDYDNPVDINAVGIYHQSGQIGFLPRNLAQRLASEIDAGNIIVAKAVNITREKVPAITIELSLE